MKKIFILLLLIWNVAVTGQVYYPFSYLKSTEQRTVYLYATNIYSSNLQSSNLTVNIPQWVDVYVNYGYSVAGASAPALTTTTSNAAIAALAFDNSDILYGITQMPHNLATTNAAFPALYIVPHVHFSVDKYIDTAHTNVTWTLVWQWANIDGSYIALQGTNSVTTGISQGATHYVANFSNITNNTAAISSIFRCRLTRPASVGQDYSNDHDVFLDQLDLHVPIGNVVGLGSRSVSTQ